jgi:alpha-galactosidase
VRFTNTSGAPLELGSVKVELPWLAAVDGVQIAVGAMQMGDGRPTIRDAGQAGIDSGTYLLARRADGSCEFAGITTWRTFWSRLALAPNGRLIVSANGDRRIVQPGETLALERIWIGSMPHWQDLLFAYADEIAGANAVKLPPVPNWVGWGSWDYFGRKFTSEAILANLDRLLELVPTANLLQIDGGWWKYRGDYFSPRESLTRGPKELSAAIHERGLVAGLHFDGFRGDLYSQVAREHPEYFLRDQHGEIITRTAKNDGDRLVHTFFDFSRDDAVDYIRRVAANIRHEWGFRYIKVDFLCYGRDEDILNLFGSTAADLKITPHNRSLTSLERARRATAAMREAVGPDTYIVACSAPFGLAYGFADGLRTSTDIHPTYDFLRRVCLENLGNFYLHGRVVYNDSDYHIARGAEDEDSSLVRNPKKSGAGLALNEVEMWTHYVGLFGGSKINSDHLPILRDERAELFRRAVSLPMCERFVPIDFWAHERTELDPPSVVLGEAEGRVCLAVFNWSDEPREFRIGGLPSAAWSSLEKLGGQPETAVAPEGLRVLLPGRHSAIFRTDGIDFDTARRAIRME